MASSPGEGDDDVGEAHVGGQQDHRDEDRGDDDRDRKRAQAGTAADSVDVLIREKRVPITAPMPTSATPRIQGGRPPSIRAVPQHAGGDHRAEHPARRKWRPQRSATAMAAATRAASSAARRHGGEHRRRGRDPGERQHERQGGGENDHAHGLHHGDRRDVSALSAASMVICDSAPGLRLAAPRSGPSRGSVAGRSWSRRSYRTSPRQQPDGQRIGAHVLDQLPRHQRAQRNPEQHQHGLGQIGGMCSGRPARAAMPTAAIAPEISPPGRFAHRNSRPPAAPGRASRACPEFWRGRQRRRKSMWGSGSRRLMANPPWRDKCVTRLQQCAAMLPWRARRNC